jgi:uncharacterized protein (TIRG00374 family)
VRHVDWHALGAALAHASWPWIAAACATVVLDRALNAYRSIVLLRAVPARPPVAELVRIFFVSTFAGTFLPSTVGADAVRAWSLAQDGVPSSTAVASVVMDRLLGVVSILIGALVGFALMPAVLENRQLAWGLAVVAGACAFALAVIFSPRVDEALRRHLTHWPARVQRVAGRLLDALQAYRRQRGVLAVVLTASVLVQALRVALGWMVGRGLGLTAPGLAYVALIPIIVLVMLLPVTINGLGTGQLAFVWGFQRVGVTPADAFALSILFAGLGIIGNLPGGILYAAGKRPALDRLEVRSQKPEG